MDLLEKLSHYIASHAYQNARPYSETGGEEGGPFVTISREAGAGGHSLANALLDQMAKESDPLFADWKVFDASFCARLLEDANLVASLGSLEREETRSPWEETVYDWVGGRGASNRVFQKSFQAMKALTHIGKLIVIGRGGACALGERPGGLHVRLVAPHSIRIDHMKQRLQISRANAERLVAEYDIERAKFVRAHFGKDIQDPLLYHATWNTARVPFDEIAQQLVLMVKTRHLKTTLV